MASYNLFQKLAGMFGKSKAPSAEISTIPAATPYNKPRAKQIETLMSQQNVMKNPWSVEEIQEALKSNVLRTPAMLEQAAQLEGLKPLLAEYMRPSEEGQTNISPILGLSDFWNKTNYLKGYQTPAQLKKEAQKQGLAANLEYVKAMEDLGKQEGDNFTARLMATTGTTTTGAKQTPVSSEGPTAKAPTHAQTKDANYAKRMEAAEKMLSQLESEGFNPTTLGSAASGVLPQIMRPDKLKAFQQAGEMFVNAQLRDDTGAVINTNEGKVALKTYLPQIGDTQAVLQQKKAARMQQLESMKANAGPAYGAIPTVEVKRNAGVNKPSGGLTPTQEKRRQELLKKKGQ